MRNTKQHETPKDPDKSGPTGQAEHETTRRRGGER